MYVLAIQCLPPTVVQPLQITTASNKTLYNYGDFIEFTCPLGYQKLKSSKKYCKNNTDFQLRLPNCKGIYLFFFAFFIILVYLTEK